MNPRFTDLVGRTFERLTVLEFAGVRGKGKDAYRYWRCLCSCGNTLIVKGASLTQNHTQFCGCLRAERALAASMEHGQCRTPEYKAWAAMKQRCHNPADAGYSNYGGRGIAVCDEWMNAFETFLRDLGKRPSKFHSLERVNNDSSYCAANCIWATKKQQCNNQRRSVRIEFNGATRTLKEWSEITGINYQTLRKRRRDQWSVALMLSSPIDGRLSTL